MNHTKSIVSIFLFLFFTHFLLGQSSSNLLKLAKEIEILQKISEEKQGKIDVLRINLSEEMSKNYSISKELERQKKTIQAKTAEILSLTGELRDISNKYQQLMWEMETLASESEQKSAIIEQLEKAQEELTSSLEKNQLETRELERALEKSRLKNELLVAKNKILENRINEITNAERYRVFAQISSINPNGYSANFTVGRMTRGNTLFLGMDLGYKSFSIDNNAGSNFQLEMELIPVSFKLRFPIADRSLGFGFVDPTIHFLDNLKLFAGIDLGWSAVVSSSALSDFNQGGPVAGFEIGAILHLFEMTNVMVFIGGEGQRVRLNREQANEVQKIYGGFRMGLGVTFF